MPPLLKGVEKEIREKVVGYIVAALGLVVGFAWNEAIKSFIEFVFPLDKNTLVAKFLYAALLTVVITVVVLYLIRILKKDDDNKKK